MRFTYEYQNNSRLWGGDCISWLTEKKRYIPFDLVFADPPFNIGYKYDQYQDKRSAYDYLSWCKKWMYAVRNIPSSFNFWIAISDEFAAELCVMAKSMGFRMRNWVVWEYNFGTHQNTKFGRNKTHLLYFTWGESAVWDISNIRVESQRQAAGDKRAKPGGRVPGDVWHFPRLNGRAKERVHWHPCQMPISVLARIVLACTPSRGRILDLFSGSGSMLETGLSLGRSVYGCEISRRYCIGINDRLAKYRVS